MNETDQAEKRNDPNANYAMYELDRVAKREGQTMNKTNKTGEGKARNTAKCIAESNPWPAIQEACDQAKRQACDEALLKVALEILKGGNS